MIIAVIVWANQCELLEQMHGPPEFSVLERIGHSVTMQCVLSTLGQVPQNNQGSTLIGIGQYGNK